MSVGLRVLSAGPGVTLQDAGRRGYLRFGVTEAGPMDRLAHATANRAVSAAEGAASIEISLGGIDLTAEGGPVAVALAGASFDIRLDAQRLPPTLLASLCPSSQLSVRAGPSGCWCYLAVGGRFALDPVMGSLSTHTRSGIGGLCGRALAAGDYLPITDARAGVSAAHIAAPHLHRRSDVIRVVLGPQEDYFSPDQIAAFLSRDWTVSPRCDRMAYCLEGDPLVHAKSFNIVSDGIPRGAVQVPGDGRPIVLMADRQPTGGYPKLATIIGADLDPLAQLRPGSRFRFAAVSIAEAVAARQAECDALQRPLVTRAIVRTDFPSEFLLEHNLVGGVFS